MTNQQLQNEHLDWLEAESIYIIREVAAQCANPTLLFSGGKDSIVMYHLARKAFQFGLRPIQIPFPLLHVDTGHNYPEVIQFRDEIVAKTNAKLIVAHVEDSIKRGTVKLRKETDSRNAAQATTLLEAIEEYSFDALMGGARRDEEKARAKERIFHSAMSLVNGILKHNVQSYGISIMPAFTRVKICGFFLFLTGQS